jgi:hypothetical protein
MHSTQPQMFPAVDEAPHDQEALALHVRYDFTGIDQLFSHEWLVKNPLTGEYIEQGGGVHKRNSGWTLTEGGMLVSRLMIVQRHLQDRYPLDKRG